MESRNQPDSIADAQKRARLSNPVLQPKETFGDYRVVKCISAGLLAHYYRVQHVRDLHEVTVGVFHPRTNGHGKFIKRLEGLRKSVASVQHEAILKIRDCSVVNERTCLFLDPVKGHTLSQYFEAHAHPGESGVGVAASSRFIAQLLGALGYAHAQGIDHRDLDTDLIFVQEDGSIRMLGMGVKAAMGIELFESIVSASVSPLEARKELHHLSSFDVMSPEYRSGVPEDSRVDVYAAGVIGYWLLTGRKPGSARYKTPTHFLDGLMPTWNTFFEKALVRDRERRFQSCKMALIGLKKTEIEATSESSGYIQKQIDRIPVPKSILERGALASRIYRLILICLVGVSGIWVAASFLTRLYSSSGDVSERVVVRADDASGANLEIRLDPDWSRVVFIGEDASFVTREGVMDLKVEPGDYRVRVSSPGHIEQTFPVSVSEDASQPQRLELALQPELVDLQVRSEPGATVSVVDPEGAREELGHADESGLLDLAEGLPPGEYDLIIEKAGYIARTIKDQALSADESAVIEAPLERSPVEVTFLSEPEGAMVRLDGVAVGRTPLRLETLKLGQAYALEVRKQGYRPIERRVEPRSAGELTVDLGELVPRAGSVRVEPRFDSGAAAPIDSLRSEMKIRVGERVLPFDTGELEALPVGRTRIELEHPLYESELVEIEIEDEALHRVPITLRPKPAELSINIPGGIEYALFVNEEPVRVEGETVEVASGQAIDLTLRMADHLTMRRQLELGPTEVFVWDVDPRPIPGPKTEQTWELPYLEIEFGWVPPGEFSMGSPLSEHARLPNEGSQTEVRLTRGFWMSIYEVTQAQFREVTGDSPARFGGDRHPVERVSWQAAKAFCRELTGIERDAGRLPEGYIYRLPTEAEWEYAARAGTETPFSWGSRADATLGQFSGVYPIDRREGLRAPEGGYGTKEVGQYDPNKFGLYDMHGNVREWTLDGYESRLPGGVIEDPEPKHGTDRIAVRGGGWEDTAARVRSAAREQASARTSSDALGFRVVLAPDL